MHRYYTDAELNAALKRMVVICDTREQANSHILEYFGKSKIPTQIRRLRTGDYSAMLDDLTLEDSVVIERKGSLDEVAGNLTADRTRFEDELTRAKAAGIKVFLFVEGATWKDIQRHSYRSKLSPKAFEASLLAWQARYNLTIVFTAKEDSAHLMHGILWYWLKNALERGD